MTNPDYTHLIMVVDRSGSMATIKDDMNGAIQTLLADQAALPGEVTLTLVTFNTEAEYTVSFGTLDEAPAYPVQPSGGTALNDTLADVIISQGKSLAEMPESERPGKVIFAIVTDGQENSSREYPHPSGTDRVRAMIEEQKSQWGWEFLFLGANDIGNVFEYAANYGVGRGETISFAASSAGVNASMGSVSDYMTRSRSGDTTGFSEEEQQIAQEGDKTI